MSSCRLQMAGTEIETAAQGGGTIEQMLDKTLLTTAAALIVFYQSKE